MLTHSSRIIPFALIGVLLLLAGCASTRPLAHQGLASSLLLRPNAGPYADRIPYSFDREVDWRIYSRVLLDRVEIYQGTDAQFDKISDAERKELAAYMEERFANRLKNRYRLVSEPGPGTLRVKLTLSGAKPTTTVVGTFTRFDLAGGPYNAVQAIRGKEGLFMGSVNYAVEIYDASREEILSAYVAKQYPNAMNVKATLGRLDAAKTGLDKGADELLTRMR